KALDCHMVAASCVIQRRGALGTGGLHDHNLAECRGRIPVRLRDEEIDERAEEISRAELKDGFVHSVTPCFQMVISRKPLISLRASFRPLATSRMSCRRLSVTLSGATPGSS